MKITCPECSASFDVPVSMIGAGGKRVRCASCNHIWVQQATPEPGAFGSFRPADDDLAMDPIPASLHPHPDDDRDDDENGGPGFFSDIKGPALARMLAGFVLGFGVMVLILFGLGAANAVPGFMMPMAQSLGFVSKIDFEGLEIQDTAADIIEKHGDKITVITGKLVNTSTRDRLVPMLEVVTVTANGKESAGLRVRPERDILKSQESTDFRAELKGALETGGQLHINMMAE